MSELKQNKHGHSVFTIIGLDLTGEQEIERLKDKYRVEKIAERILRSTENKDSYDKRHRLVAGKKYKIALIPTGEFLHSGIYGREERLKYGIKKYGYMKPLAGIIPRVGEYFKNNLLEMEVGIYFPHDTFNSISDELLKSHKEYLKYWGGWGRKRISFLDENCPNALFLRWINRNICLHGDISCDWISNIYSGSGYGEVDPSNSLHIKRIEYDAYAFMRQ